MTRFNVPTEPNRFAVLLQSPAMPGGVPIGQTDLIEYAVFLAHGALSQLELPKDAGTRVLVIDTVGVSGHRTVHAGMLDSTGSPTFDGAPMVGVTR